MAGHGSRPSRLSYAGRDPDLSRDTPVSLARMRQALRPAFDHNRDPYVSAQLKAQKKTEAQRRKESSGRGSEMVKLHRPFPVLRPKHEQGPLRASFNQAWLREQRAAQLARFEQERMQARQGPDYARHEPQRVPERER